MARPPKFIHRLRALRAKLPKKQSTQKAFAKLVGVSPTTIKRIENGSLALSHKMVVQIALATGVSSDSLISGSELRNQIDGQPFTEGYFATYRSRLETRPEGGLENAKQLEIPEDRLDRARTHFLEFSALLEAAWFANCFDQVLHLFYEWLFKTISAYDLEVAFRVTAETHQGKIINPLLFAHLAQQLHCKDEARLQRVKKTGNRELQPRNYKLKPPKDWREIIENDSEGNRPIWLDTPSGSPFGEWLRRRPLSQWLYTIDGEVIPELKKDWDRMHAGKCPVCGFNQEQHAKNGHHKESTSTNVAGGNANSKRLRAKE